MAGEETTGSKWFWWVMGIVATVVAAAIITALHLSGAQSASGGTSGGGTSGGGIQTTATDYSGTYNGQALNGGAVGNVQLQVNEPDQSSGATTARVAWSGALNGAGPLRGTFNANNATFEGEIASQEGPWDMDMSCTFSISGNVTCNYQLQPVAPNNYGPQQGSLSATKS
jgi:hypothetical protein